MAESACAVKIFIEQMCSMKKKAARKRPYTMKARADAVAQTRRRIVDAAVELHEQRGPGYTSIKSIAERAGVERATVYRHFKDEEAVLLACSSQFLQDHPPPNPEGWLAVEDPVVRFRAGLAELYEFFALTSDMLAKSYRDVDSTPTLRQIMNDFDAYLGQLASVLGSAWPADDRQPVRGKVLRHATRFSTWSALEQEGLLNDAKVGLLELWLKGLETGG